MRANQRWITPTADGWTISSSASPETFAGTTYGTPKEAMAAAREDLLASGGGELIVQSADGRTIRKDTVGQPEPASTSG